LRLSVTDRCDLRCQYCLPKGFKDFHEPDDWLRFDEIERIVASFARLGVKRVRITGGEPLVRKDLPLLAARLNRIAAVQDLSLSTNAIRLGRLAQALRCAGVKRVNVSLDSLDTQRYREITGGGQLYKVLSSLEQAKQVGFRPIKINMVVQKGINDDEVEDMMTFCIGHGFVLRLIETMPMGATGRSAMDHYADLQDIKKRLVAKYELVPDILPGGGPARYFRLAGTGFVVGFITPISQHFCETCNRVRLAVDGTLYLCLGQEYSVDLRCLVRAGVTDRVLDEALQAAIARKPERHQFTDKPEQVIRFMSATGG
jgi:cyclic pyranopterin phosphate synthase